MILLLACHDPVDSAQPADSPSGDPLSMPDTPTLDPADFPTARTCAECHPDHYAQWRTSSHAYAMEDPVFRALSGARMEAFAHEEDGFCTQCHSAIGTRGGECVDGFSWDALSEVVQEGVTCAACHRIDGVERAWNAGHTLSDGTLRATIALPETTEAHRSAGDSLFASAELCGSCHDVVEASGLPLERAYAEWQDSPAAETRTCQTCHMPGHEGAAADGGPTRTVHDHRFTGVDVPFAGSFATDAERATLAAEVGALLDGAATVSLQLPSDTAPGPLDVVVTIENQIDAHNLPTGSTFNRQLWLELIVTDAAGMVLYETGTLDADGDLRNRWSGLDPYGDHDLVQLGSGFVDAQGEPTLFPWLAAEHLSTTLAPLHSRTDTFFVTVPEGATGPLTVTARLRFRSLGPFLLRALGLEDAAADLPIWDVDSVRAELPLR